MLKKIWFQILERVVGLSVAPESGWSWTVCKIARCNDWSRYFLLLVMGAIRILYSTLKFGCRQSIISLGLGRACRLGTSIVTPVSVQGGWAVCKTARCHDWWRHCLSLVMESIHILQKYVESRMQTAYHSAAPGQCSRGRCLGRGRAGSGCV